MSKGVNSKTLEQLENDVWESPPSFPTELVKNVFDLRKKQLQDLDANDLRILISQNVGLAYTIPKALSILKDNILFEASYYPGDLLSTVINVENEYWAANQNELKDLILVVRKSKDNIVINDEVDEELLNTVNLFLSKYNL